MALHVRVLALMLPHAIPLSKHVCTHVLLHVKCVTGQKSARTYSEVSVSGHVGVACGMLPSYAVILAKHEACAYKATLAGIHTFCGFLNACTVLHAVMLVCDTT